MKFAALCACQQFGGGRADGRVEEPTNRLTNASKMVWKEPGTLLPTNSMNPQTLAWMFGRSTTESLHSGSCLPQLSFSPSASRAELRPKTTLSGLQFLIRVVSWSLVPVNRRFSSVWAWDNGACSIVKYGKIIERERLRN